jgi:3-oxoacyl-[acyl-carrier protein] reductase
VVVNDLDDGPANETLAEIKALGSEGIACNGDVTKEGFAERFVAAGIDSWGGLDIIVNNAGYTWDNVIQKMTDEQWYAILDVHLTAPFRIMRAAQRFIREAARKEAEEGREVFRKVVNISSTSGVFGNAGQANYSTAKAGIQGLTRAMAKEWGRYKVNVNAVAFGLIMTRLTEAPAHGGASIDISGREIPVGVRPEVLQTAEKMIPLGRGGRPEEAAGSVYLFCIPESNYVTGQTLVVSGGRP